MPPLASSMSSRPVRTVASLLVLAGILALAPKSAHAFVQVPANFVVENAAQAGFLTVPVAIAPLPDGRILVGEKSGRVMVIQNGFGVPTPMLDLQQEVLNEGDRGLLGLAVDPNFAWNRYLYVLYTVDPDSNGIDDNDDAFGRLARYQVSLNDPNVVDPASRTILMGATWHDGPASGSNSHTVGGLRFGSDGSLLVSTGDGAQSAGIDSGGVDPSLFLPGRTDSSENVGAFRAQALTSLDGKILRIDPATGEGLPSNPFWNGDPASVRSRVWATGLRNPFRFSTRPGTGSTNPADGRPGAVFVGDVGWMTWEEIDVSAQGGENFGWPSYEGPTVNPAYSAVEMPGLGLGAVGTLGGPSPPVAPGIAWSHQDSTVGTPPGFKGDCAVGGVFYEGSQYPAQYRDAYFFADFGNSTIRTAIFDQQQHLVSVAAFGTDADRPVDFAVDPSTGDVLYLSIATSMIHRIRYLPPSTNHRPVAVADATPLQGITPFDVQFSSAGSSDADGDSLMTIWNFGDGFGTTEPNPLHTYTMGGTHLAVLTVRDARSFTRDTVIVVATPPIPNSPPNSVIMSPADGSFYWAGETIPLESASRDSQDTVSQLTYRWDLDLHHEEHVHPDTYEFDLANASFLAENYEDGDGIFLEIRLTTTDRGMLSDTASVRIYPEIDLEATPPVVSIDPPAPWDTARVSFQIVNHGRMPAPASRWLLRVDGTTVAQGDVPVAGLGSASLTAPLPQNLALGNHTLDVVVDAFDDVHEVTETNDVTSRTLTVANPAALSPGVFPVSATLDGFDRPNGSPGPSWAGDASAMGISSQLVGPLGTGYAGMTWGAWYGPNQEAFVTLASIGSGTTRQALLLKAQGYAAGAGAIEVRFDGGLKQVTVATFTPGAGWQDRGSGFPVKLGKSASVLGARALANGDVEVWWNGRKVGVQSVGAWPWAYRGGRIGIAFEKSSALRDDNFGGGSVLNRAPIANASASPASGTAPLPVSFSSSGSSDPDGDPLTMSWAFGDGQTSSASSSQHTYASAGTYAAILTVSDNHGAQARDTVTVTVLPGVPPFPSAPVLDAFDRANGPIGPDWTGDSTAFAIETNVLKPTGTSLAGAVWNRAAFGAEQEAYVTLAAISTGATYQGVLLKVQGASYAAGAVAMYYDANQKRFFVSTYTPGSGWQVRGTGVSARVARNDVIGARARMNGDVEMYMNGVKIATRSTSGWAYAGAGGRVGVILGNAGATRLDRFGGGTLTLVGAAASRSAESASLVPHALALSLPYPNPSADRVSMALDMPQSGSLGVSVLDLQGRVVWTESRSMGAGRWILEWPGTFASGRRAGPGIYWARVLVGKQTFVRRVLLIP